MKTYFRQLVTVYTTTKVVGIKSPLVAIVHVCLVILVWCAFLGSLHLDVRKMYQKSCHVHGVVLTKVKGFASTEHLTDQQLNVQNPNLYRRTWDPADIVYPAAGGEGETGSFTIVTNMIITPNQTLGRCPDDATSKCESDAECDTGFWSPATHGAYTGKCLRNEGTCEINGWCPIERGRLPLGGQRALLEDVKDFTVLLKNTVDFPGCSDPYRVRNLPTYVTQDYLRKCRWNRMSDPLCPIFRIGDIVEWSGDNFTKTAVLGGVFRIKMRWNCDLDFGRTVGDCQPTYEFLRVDDDAGMFSGMNFRSADFYSDNQRTLRKQFGLKILIDLEGEGRKFDLFQLIIKLGAIIGLLSVASLVCNWLLGLLNKLNKAQICNNPLLTVVQNDDGLSISNKDKPPNEVITATSERSGSVASWIETDSSKLKHEYHVNKAFSCNDQELYNSRDSFKSIAGE